MIDFVHAKGGLDYAAKAMFEYQEEAFQLLEGFPESPSLTSLKELVRFTTERKK